jgi:hypothetical protein
MQVYRRYVALVRKKIDLREPYSSAQSLSVGTARNYNSKTTLLWGPQVQHKKTTFELAATET